MSDLYTAAHQAERAARRACDHDRPDYERGYKGEPTCTVCRGAWHDCGCMEYSAATDEARALCLAAAEACEALSAAITRCDHDCLHQTRSDIVQAIADDYAARAQKWRKVARHDRLA